MVPEDLVAFADASLLRRVFQNLIANAIMYTPRGEVRIGAEPGAADGAVECWVSDDGAGIPPELLDTVFEKGAGDPRKGREHRAGPGDRQDLPRGARRRGARRERVGPRHDECASTSGATRGLKFRATAMRPAFVPADRSGADRAW